MAKPPMVYENKKKLILIIDDEVDLVSIVKSHLEKRGYSVQLAHDGDEGLAKANTLNPDLILLDINLPKRSGLSLYNQLTTQYGRPKVPIIIFTARDELGDLFGDVKVDGFISKPFETTDMFNEIERVLSKRDAATIFLMDTAPQAKDLAAKLERERYKVVIIKDVEELLNQAGQTRIDFVLMEYLQEMGRGEDCIGDLKKAFLKLRPQNFPPSGRIPIIVYSFSGFDFGEKSLKAGADKYIGKPRNSDEVVAAIRQFEIQPRK